MDDVLDKALSWPGLANLNAAQDLLDKNKLLISEIHRNHEMRTTEALARNKVLIHELNSNVSNVVKLYQDLAQHIAHMQMPSMVSMSEGGQQEMSQQQSQGGQ